MKRIMKKLMAFTLAMVIALTTVLCVAPNTMQVQAASSVYFIFQDNVVTYKPGDKCTEYGLGIAIMGCEKKSQIKNLKSSNKAVKVEASDGCIVARYGNKAVKTNITCTVKGVKLKTTLTIKKYTNPVSMFKIDKTNITSKFNKTNSYVQKKTFKKKKVSVQMKKGWRITSVSVYNNGKTKWYDVNGSKFSKTISLTSDEYDITVHYRNEKGTISDWVNLCRFNY